jgi:hypothetical protein
VGNTFSGIPAYGFAILNASSTINYYTNNTTTTPVSGVAVNSSSTFPSSCHAPSDCKTWPLAIKYQIDNTFKIKIYPNPATDQVLFDFSSLPAQSRNLSINITDALGKLIDHYMIRSEGFIWNLNTSKYADGIYMYHVIVNGNQENSGKFEIKH